MTTILFLFTIAMMWNIADALKLPSMNSILRHQKDAMKKLSVTVAASLMVTAPLVSHASFLTATPTLVINREFLQSPTEFFVVRATEEEKSRLKVDTWETWNSGDVRFKNKVYSVNEICFIDRGAFTITPEGGSPVKVQAGDFVTFPSGFKCKWDITEQVFKHWKEY